MKSHLRTRELVSEVRHQLSEFSISDPDTYVERAIDRLKLKDRRALDRIVDCFFLFEDVEMAKDHIRRNGFGSHSRKPTFGLLYLKLYGLLNACYLEKEAIKTCSRILGLPESNWRPLEELAMMKVRNDFAAHAPNRGRKEKEHSFLLDRHALREGRVSGYSSNSIPEDTYQDEEVEHILSIWDQVVFLTMENIANEITRKLKN